MTRHHANLLIGLVCIGLAIAIAGTALAQAIATHEVLVLASAPTQITRTVNTTSVELQNLGPNNIWCGVSADAGVAVVNKSHRVDAISGAWVVDAPYQRKIWCIAQGADQVTGGATIVTENAP